MRGRVAAVALTLASVTLCGSPAVAAPVGSHARLNSSTPAPDALLAQAPVAVELGFNRDIAPPASVAVTSPSGHRVGSGEPVVAGPVVTAPIAAREKGTYTVAFRAVSVDGHPITGRFTFSIGHRGAAYAASGQATASRATWGRAGWVVPVAVSGAAAVAVAGARLRTRRRRDAAR